MKILHTADWHLGKLLEGRSRLEEQKIVMEQLVAMADERQADMVCVAGDIFDNGHPSAGAEALLYQTLKDLSNGGERLVVLIAGNHDQPSRLEAVIPLVREHGILIYGTPRSKIESGQYGKFQIESLDEGVQKLCGARELAPGEEEDRRERSLDDGRVRGHVLYEGCDGPADELPIAVEGDVIRGIVVIEDP